MDQLLRLVDLDTVAAAIGVAAGVLLGTRLEKRGRQPRGVRFALGGILAAVGTAALFTLWRSGILGAAVIVIAESETVWHVVATIGCIAFGSALYLLRRKALRVYAVSELAVAAVTIYATWVRISAADGAELQAATWLPLAGGVYLVVRGLDNFLKPKEE